MLWLTIAIYIRTQNIVSHAQSIVIATYISYMVMGIVNKDSVPGASLFPTTLSIVSLVLLFGVTWHFEASLNRLQQQVEYDRELLLKLQVLYE